SELKLAAGKAADLTGYKDAGAAAAYSRESISALVKAGIVEGSGGLLHPKANLNRAEAAVLFYRIYSLINP
ncbi:S-layer homology domain-containing protein, partial [Paenibacillus sepulcri]|nr:S-layer homology domain-containing protein [Paenibacillus sepulcri]